MQKRISIYCGQELAELIGQGRDTSSRSGRINTIADRYAYILNGVRLDLSDAEMNLIRDVGNGTVFEPAQIGVPGIVIAVHDGIGLDKLDEKWGVDGPALLRKLMAASRAELAWLAEDVERFWSKESPADREKED